MQPTGKDQNYWFERLLSLWPWELMEFYNKAGNDNEEVFGEIHFHIAVARCYLNQARFNRFLSNEDREVAMSHAHRTENLIYKSWTKYPEMLAPFKRAFQYDLESTAKFGWPNEIINQEINNLMIPKIQFFVGITTEDHAHVVLSRFEDVLKKILGEEVHRDIFGDPMRGEVGFLFLETPAKIVQVDEQTLEAYFSGSTDAQTEKGVSALKTFLLKVYQDKFADKIVASEYTRPRIA
jgi:hypothetical protein